MNGSNDIPALSNFIRDLGKCGKGHFTAALITIDLLVYQAGYFRAVASQYSVNLCCISILQTAKTWQSKKFSIFIFLPFLLHHTRPQLDVRMFPGFIKPGFNLTGFIHFPLGFQALPEAEQ